MIYILTTQETIDSEKKGYLNSTDRLKIAFASSSDAHPSVVITRHSIQSMVDNHAVPASASDVILAFDCNAKLVANLKILEKRGWRIINQPQVGLDIRNNLRTKDRVKNTAVPVRKLHDTHFPIYEDKHVRPRPPIEGSIRYYFTTISDVPREFVIMPKYNIVRWDDANQNAVQGHIVRDINEFDWSTVDAKEQIYIIADGVPSQTIRVPVIGSKPVLDAVVATDRPFIDNLKFTENYDAVTAWPELPAYCQTLVEVTKLEIGYFDFQVVNGRLEFLQGSNFIQTYANPTKLEPLIADYVKNKIR